MVELIVSFSIFTILTISPISAAVEYSWGRDAVANWEGLTGANSPELLSQVFYPIVAIGVTLIGSLFWKPLKTALVSSSSLLLLIAGCSLYLVHSFFIAANVFGWES